MSPSFGLLPRLGEPLDRGEVVGRLVGERRVLQGPELEVRDEVSGRDVRAVEVLVQPDRQRDLFIVVLRGDPGGESRGERDGGRDPSDDGDG